MGEMQSSRNTSGTLDFPNYSDFHPDAQCLCSIIEIVFIPSPDEITSSDILISRFAAIHNYQSIDRINGLPQSYLKQQSPQLCCAACRHRYSPHAVMYQAQTTYQ